MSQLQPELARLIPTSNGDVTEWDADSIQFTPPKFHHEITIAESIPGW